MAPPVYEEQATNEIIKLNVGGHNFTTMRTMLCSIPDSFFVSMFIILVLQHYKTRMVISLLTEMECNSSMSSITYTAEHLILPQGHNVLMMSNTTGLMA
jgi:hypothetical protein